MSHEPTRIDQWLYATLTGDTQLAALLPGGWHTPAAPEGTTGRYGVFSHYDPDDVTSHNGTRIMVRPVYTVRAVADVESYDAGLEASADRIDALLQRSAGGTARTAAIFTSVRRYPYQDMTLFEGKQFRSLGGVYEIFAQIP